MHAGRCIHTGNTGGRGKVLLVHCLKDFLCFKGRSGELQERPEMGQQVSSVCVGGGGGSFELPFRIATESSTPETDISIRLKPREPGGLEDRA